MGDAQVAGAIATVDDNQPLVKKKTKPRGQSQASQAPAPYAPVREGMVVVGAMAGPGSTGVGSWDGVVGAKWQTPVPGPTPGQQMALQAGKVQLELK